MERKEKTSKAVKWQKLGKKPITLMSGRIIQPGEVFMAELSEIPQGFADLFMRVSEENPKMERKEQKQNIPPAPPVSESNPPVVPDNQIPDEDISDEEESVGGNARTESRYRIQHTNGGWYIVIDSETGEPVDANNYRKPKAQEIADELNAIAEEE